MGAGQECKVTNGGEPMLEREVVVPPILRLPWPEEGSLHPYARQKYLKFLAEIQTEAPGVYAAVEEDLRAFLSDSEYSKLVACEDEIKGWLQKCSKDNDKVTLRVYPYHSPFDAMWDLKKILKGVAERKAEKKRRLAALEGIGPPFDDAEKYLTSEERQRFFDSIPGAIDAYLGRNKGAESSFPGIWLLTSKATDYIHWTGVIEDRRKEEIRQKQVAVKYDR